MTQIEEQPQGQERQSAENLRLYSYMHENFSRIYDLLAPITANTIRNENYMRQIIFNLQHPDANQANTEVGNREYLQNMLNRSHERFAGSSNVRRSEESTAEHDNSLSNGNNEQAGTSTEDMKGQSSPSTSKGQESPGSDEIVKPRRKRKLNEDYNPVVIHCTDCNQVFVKGDGSYTRHLKEIKCSPHECPKCGKRFKKKSYLKIHISNHDRDIDEPTPKKVRFKQELPATTTPADLSVKKEDQNNNSNFLSSLNLFENSRSEDD